MYNYSTRSDSVELLTMFLIEVIRQYSKPDLSFPAEKHDQHLREAGTVQEEEAGAGEEGGEEGIDMEHNNPPGSQEESSP